VRARTHAVVARGGRLSQLHCEPPLTVRRVRSDDAGTCALCLVGTAAGPLAGDELELCLELTDGAVATLQAAGATIAQGAGGARTMRTTVRLGAGAGLGAHPGAAIGARGSRVDIAVAIDLAADAAVEWHELVVLGRAGEDAGAATLCWDVVRAGRPVLRQFVDLADPWLASWPGMVAGARVIATALLSGPHIAAQTVVASATAVAARLDEHTVLATVLASDAASAQQQLAALVAGCRHGAGPARRS
jgi:urease accessory protein